MRSRLFAVVLAATAAAAPTAASASHYSRECGGILDAQCSGWVCSLDCFRRDCLLWVDPLHDPHLALCVPPLGPVSV